MSTYSFQFFNSDCAFLFQLSSAFQFPRTKDNSDNETLASPTTACAICLFASNLAALIDTSLKFGFSKFAQDPVVKSASLVPTAIAKSVFFAILFAALPPRPPIGPKK